jgi:hypothetical protein
LHAGQAELHALNSQRKKTGVTQKGNTGREGNTVTGSLSDLCLKVTTSGGALGLAHFEKSFPFA